MTVETFALYGIRQPYHSNNQRILVFSQRRCYAVPHEQHDQNWTTTTTQVVKLSAHLLSMLYCCAFISRMRIVLTVTLVKAGLYEESFPNCDHVMQHERSVAHRQYTYTHTHTQRHWHAGIHNTVCIDQLTCTRPGNKHLAQWICQNVPGST